MRGGCPPRRPEVARTHEVDGHNFTGGLLDLAELAKVVPEAGLGDDFVGRKDTHAVDFGCWLMLGRKMAADNLVFLERHLLEHAVRIQ